MDLLIEANDSERIELQISNLYTNMQRKRESPLMDLLMEATKSAGIELVKIQLILVNVLKCPTSPSYGPLCSVYKTHVPLSLTSGF